MLCARNISRIASVNQLNKLTVRTFADHLYISNGSRGTTSNKVISDTSVMVQDGINIQELPCVVRILNGEFIVRNKARRQLGNSSDGLSVEIPEEMKCFKVVDFEEEQEMIMGFRRCQTVREIYILLETIPEEEVTPTVALTCVHRIFDLENNMQYRNMERNLHYDETSSTFIRNAVIQRLIETICAGPENQVKVDALRALSRDTYRGDKCEYGEKLCTECIVQASESKMSVSQICEMVKALYASKCFLNDVDKMWASLAEKCHEIDLIDFMKVVGILPVLKKSQDYVYNLAENRLDHLWPEMKPSDVILLLQVLVQIKKSSRRLMAIISHWTLVNCHKLSESNFRWIIYCFKYLDYIDPSMEKVIEKFIKAKKENITDMSVITVIMDYCVQMRFRSEFILETAANFVIDKASDLSVSQICSLVRPFGILNYVPSDRQRFFRALESVLLSKFVQFPPHEIADILLSCVCMNVYPVNFASKVFHSDFLDRVYSMKSELIDSTMAKLQVFDVSIARESHNWSARQLPKKYTLGDFRKDVRIFRLLYRIQPILIEMVGGEEHKVSIGVGLQDFPNVEIYTVDCILHLRNIFNAFDLSVRRSDYALLIHTPDHFTRGPDEILLGMQVMRKRHIKLGDLIPVSLEYDILNKLSVYPNALKEYIRSEMEREATALTSP